MTDTLRTFIAIPVPMTVTAFVADVQDRLKRTGASVRWVRPENVHLTLAFLGDIDAGRTAAVAGQIDAVATDTVRFHLSAGGVGVFPDLRRARVLWVGLRGDIDRLAALKTRLDDALAEIGFRPERRPFRPHLTIGRPRRRLPPGDATRWMAELQSESTESFAVDRLAFYQSTLKPTGAVYTLLHSAPLACGR